MRQEAAKAGTAPVPAPDERTARIGFLLLPEFPIYALFLASEALRVANQYTGRALYSTHLFSVDGRPVKSGSGASLAPEAAIADVASFPTVFVCAGNQPTQHISKPLLNWLRRLARHGAQVGAIDTGTFTLAAAGLLDGYRATVHWEAMAMFRELYPDIAITEQLFLIDRNRLTCAGGAAALDLMLTMIARAHGAALAQLIASGFIHERIRSDTEQQRLSAQAGLGRFDPQLMRIVQEMEENLETPLGPADLAARAGMSVRALERLIQRHFADSPMRYYLKIRLQAARNLLFYSDASIQEVASSCGFSSAALFSRTFRAHFDRSPRDFRQQFRSDQLSRFRPEIRSHAA
jgi:AraC family carnitine catabolism transcriptional activator